METTIKYAQEELTQMEICRFVNEGLQDDVIRRTEQKL